MQPSDLSLTRLLTAPLRFVARGLGHAEATDPALHRSLAELREQAPVPASSDGSDAERVKWAGIVAVAYDCATVLPPTAAAQLRRLLELEAGASAEQIVAAVVRLRDLSDAALSVGFSAEWQSVMQRGRVDARHRETWRRNFYDDPESTRALLRAERKS